MTNLVQFATANKILLIPLSRIVENPFQKRVEYGDIGELADRIAAAHDSFAATMGLMQVPRGRVVNAEGELVEFQKAAPLSERDMDWEGRGLRIQLMYGHRRWKAMQLLCERGKYPWNQKVMPVQITDASSRDMLLSVWEENERRQNLTAIEQAHLMAAAKLELGESASQRDVAEFFGLARPTVANRMSLLELPQEMQVMNQTGQLSERQLLALKPLVELDRKVRRVKALKKATFDFGDQVSSYGTPASPSVYLQWIQKVEQKPTGDEIREYVKRISRAAGETLPEVVASFTAHLMPDDTIEQPECKGCGHRLDNTCLVKKCLEAKKKQYGESLARQVAAEHGLEFSDRPADFAGMDDCDILGAFKKKSCEHLVIGWKEGGYHQARPFARGSWANSPFDADSRDGIIVGHRGKLCEAIKIKGGQTVDTARPGAEEAAAYKKAVDKLTLKYRGLFIRVVTARVKQDTPGAALNIFVQMSTPKGYENVNQDDYPELMVRYFFDKSGMSYTYHELKWYTRLLDFLDQVGIGRDALWVGLSMNEQWKDWATFVLHEYADNFNSLDRDWYKDTRTLIGEHIPPLLRWYETDQTMTIDGSIVEMVEKLQDAAAYIQGIEQKEQEKAQGEGTLMKVLADNAAACDECSEPCVEEGDGVACSCGAARGAVLCEDCYVEHGHMAHDTNPDNAWMRELAEVGA